MCTHFGYSTVLRQLSHRPRRPHSTALAAPRATGRATGEVGTGTVHLASDRATIAPTNRHPGQQLAATATLGKAAVGVAPASTTIHPGRPTRPGWPPYLYCRRQGCFRTKYLATPAAAARLNSMGSVVMQRTDTDSHATAVTVQQQHRCHQQWQQLGQQHSTLQQQWHHVRQQQQCIQQLQSEVHVQQIQAQQSQQLDLFVHPQNQATHCKLCGLGQRVTELEQQQQAQISQLEAAMAQQTQNQIQCALHQQQQARISALEAERAVTAQQVEVQVQTALSKHQHQQQTQIAKLVQEQMHLHAEQHQTETGEQERES